MAIVNFPSLSLSVSGHPWRSLLLAVLLSIALRATSYRLRVRRFPPGPPKHLLLDNRGDMTFPLTKNWLNFDEWHRKWGKIVSFYLGRRHVICE